MEKKQTKVGQIVNKVFFETREIGVIIPMVVFLVYFSAKNPNFLSEVNIINILRSASFTLISAVGMTFLLITGSFDLAAGAEVALAGVSTGLALQAGMGIPLAILIGLLSAALAGVFLGFCSVNLKIPVFIAGIGVQYAINGVVLVMTEGAPVYPLPQAFNDIAEISIGKLPLVVVIALVIALIGSFVLRYTVFGRKLFAVGGNEETSRLAGIRCNLIRFAAFIISAGLTGISGILTAARLNSGQPNAGADFPTTVIAACVIGGISLFGGAGSILAAILGSLFMTMLTNGMTITGISPYYQKLVLGVILLLSVAFDQFRNSRKA